ncbi:MAG: hypothetical protein IPM22_14390 [Betaproteobacteria bacterium]|jgi:uncharacterized protein (TIGR00725 family)|nr:hypothetical protein [Betaproteobacteria bacterium]MCC7217318.1 lysine decarboxylase [Burkholderiales bacterium]
MNATFDLDRAARMLYDAQGRSFDAVSRAWTYVRSAEHVVHGERVDVVGAATWLQRESGHPLRVPVGVVGPREATTAQLSAALRVGERLADCGFVVVCGGRGGVMQAVCEGVKRVGGTSLGLLPEAEPAFANHYVDIVLATGMGEGRNALIACASFCLIAIGDSYGTLSEVALGRQYGRLVVGLEGAPQVEGVVHVDSTHEAIERVAAAALGVEA